MLYIRTQNVKILSEYLKCALQTVRFVSKPLKPHKQKGHERQPKKFVDFCNVTVKGGSGGSGIVSFLSLFRNEFAGPDGGNGGHGGHVIFQVGVGVKSLSHLPAVLHGENGEKGGNKNCYGKNAQHTYIQVPSGTVIKDENGQILTELNNETEYYIAGRGGAGGKGNAFFLSNENRIPKVAEAGANGEEKIIHVELKTMAHAGFIGFPNSGKSTLLRAISRARPKVASYPFTTLNPHIGMVIYDDYEQIAVADIPGLIEGAHQNRGLGISFLRHIDRCACLLYVLDLSIDEPWTQLELLKYELEQYESGLSERPHAIVANKSDIIGTEDKVTKLKDLVNVPVFVVSAKYKTGIDQFLLYLRETYDKYGQKTSAGW